MKVFISQPMANKTSEQIKSERKLVEEKIKEEYGDVEIIDSYLENFNGNPIEFLGESIKLLGKADLAVFMDGYIESRGCLFEHSVCRQYGVPTKYLNF